MKFVELVRAEKRNRREVITKSSDIIESETSPYRQGCERPEPFNVIISPQPLNIFHHISSDKVKNIVKEVVGHIGNIIYIPNFVDTGEEMNLLCCIESQGKWERLKSRRLQCWGGNPSSCDLDTVEFKPLPPWLQVIADSLVLTKIFDQNESPNHVLINQYNPGEGILHHTDGPNYLNKVAIISLGSSAVMSFRPKLLPSEIGIKCGDDVLSVFLEPRSLLLFSNDAYDNYLHGIDFLEEDTIGHPVVCVNAKQANVRFGDVVRLQIHPLFSLLFSTLFLVFRHILLFNNMNRFLEKSGRP